MNFTDMRRRAEILYESIASNDAPGFTASEWGELFTQAQSDVVNDILIDGAAKNAYNRRAIDALVHYQEFTTTDAGPSVTVHPKYPNAYLVDIESVAIGLTEDTVWWVLSIGATGTHGTTAFSNVEVNEITYSTYRSNLTNPYRKPSYEDEFWYFPEDKNLVIIVDSSSTLTSVLIEYVEDLSTHNIVMGTDCILHESVHPIIVKRAVEIAHASVQDQTGFQLQALENQNPRLP